MNSSEFNLNKYTRIDHIFNWRKSYLPLTSAILLLEIRPFSVAITCALLLIVIEHLRYPKRILVEDMTITFRSVLSTKKFRLDQLILLKSSKENLWIIRIIRPFTNALIELNTEEAAELERRINVARSHQDALIQKTADN